MFTTYPTSSDVSVLLTESGVTVPPTMDLDVYAAEAVEQWEAGTGYQPFLADSSETERTYDPPGPNRRGLMRGGGTLLFLNTGFVALAEVRQDGVQLDHAVDYRTLPYAGRGPVTALEFTSPVWGKPASLTVRGRLGYSEGLGADVWSAIRKLAASLALAAMREGADHVTVIQSGEDRIQYKSALGWATAWRREAQLAMAAKRLVA